MSQAPQEPAPDSGPGPGSGRKKWRRPLAPPERQEMLKRLRQRRDRLQAAGLRPALPPPVRPPAARRFAALVAGAALAGGLLLWWAFDQPVMRNFAPPLPPALEAGPLPPAPGAPALVPLACREVPDARLAPLADFMPPGSRQARQAQAECVRSQHLPLEIENSLGMRFRLLPPGLFRMGSPPDEPGRRPDEVLHDVRFERPFYLGKYEVTQAEWQAVMGQFPGPARGDAARLPVEQVTWDDCQRFLMRLCTREGLPPGTYRLPSEAEWEYACRAGSGAAFCFGPDPRRLALFADCRATHAFAPGPVGSHWPNAWGLYDMHGNVWEWCQDLYTYFETGVQDSQRRSLRGGNWYLEAPDCRSAARYRYPPDSSGNILGLRVLREIGTPEALLLR